MPTTVLPASPADLPILVSIIYNVIGGRSTFVNAITPNNLDPAVQEQQVRLFGKIGETDTGERLLKAVDDATGKITAAAWWQIFDGKNPQEPPFPDDVIAEHGLLGVTEGLRKREVGKGEDDERAWARALWESYWEYPVRVAREFGGPVLFLYSLMVDTEYQKQGIGAALTKWGTDQADEMGAECCLHASLAGKPLYEKFGFVLQEHTELKVPEKFANKDAVQALLMRRPATTRKE